jgi:hypothetical protein
MTAVISGNPRRRLRMALVSLGATMGGTLSGLLLSLLTGRLIGAVELGKYVLAAAPALVATSLSGIGEQRLVLKVAGDYGPRLAFWSVLSTSFRVTAKVVAVALAGAAFVFMALLGKPALFPLAAVLLIVFLLIDNTIASLDGILLSANRSGTVGGMRAVSPIIHASLVLLCVPFIGKTYWNLVLAQTLGNGGVALFKAWQVRELVWPFVALRERREATLSIRRVQNTLIATNAGVSLVKSFPPFIINLGYKVPGGSVAQLAVADASVAAFSRATTVAQQMSSVISFFELSNFSSVVDKRAESDLFVKSFRIVENFAGALLMLGSAGGLIITYIMPIYGKSFEVESVRFMSFLGLHYALEAVGVGVMSASWAAYPVEKLSKVLALGCIPSFLVAVAWWFFRFEAAIGATAVMSALTLSHLAVGLVVSLRKTPTEAKRWAKGCIARLFAQLGVCVALLAWAAYGATRFQSAVVAALLLGLAVGQLLPAANQLRNRR